MDKVEYPSDSDQSDEDFCPEIVESEEPSEDDSNGSEQESEEENIKAEKQAKSGKGKHRSRQRKKPDTHRNESQEHVKNAAEIGSDDETEKKRTDALWADFLSDVNGSSQDSGSSRPCNTKKRPNKSEQPLEPPQKVKVTEVFDFAGEEVKIIKEVPANNKEENIAQTTQGKQVPKFLKGPPIKRPAGGINSVLNAIGKKNKISVLEKSKMDWDGFKKNEGLSEEIKTFNKGRDGYLERQDFLQRTDLRQFEIEKGLRQSKRSNR